MYHITVVQIKKIAVEKIQTVDFKWKIVTKKYFLMNTEAEKLEF